MSKFDCIIIGAGHNGLVAAAYLAKAGRKVCVLEKRHVLGGCSSTEELWSGFKVSPAAYVISLFLPRIIRELKLKENGLKILPRDPSSFTPLPDGRSLLLGHDAESNRKQIAKFSQKDADAYPRYESFLTRTAEALEPLMESRLPKFPPGPIDMIKWWQLIKPVKQLGGDLQSAVELMTGAATPILHRWFESEALKATLATDAIIGAFMPPSSPGSAYVLLHHVMGHAGGKRGVWGYVRGGMGGLADVLATVCEQLGVEVRCESAVAGIDVKGGVASGVTFENGDSIDAPVVISNVDANVTFLKLLGRDHLSGEFTESIEAIDYASASAKINLALDGLPDLNTGDVDPAIALRGTTHISPTIEYIERAYDDAKYGMPSRRPVLEITMPTTVDDTLAPAGKHIMSMFVQYAPYELADGNWDDDLRNAFADTCINVLAEYAPNIHDIVLHRQVLTPVDLERVYGLTGGNIFQGAMNLHQLGPMRSACRTPIRGLYLCGAATHPGGGVLGACGLNAAETVLRG